jgi:DNA repair photolyase
MIISASRRTDIPAFYTEWFMNRIREGKLYVRNPFNARQIRRVDLLPENVDAIVFWTRTPLPIISCLDELNERGYRYYFHVTLTGYPKVLEPMAPSEAEVLSALKVLSRKIGPEKVIWRFDPIILSDATPEAVLLENFERLAGQLEGATQRVVISFLTFYKSVKRAFDKIRKEQGLQFYDNSSTPEQALRIASGLAGIARAKSMEIVSCAGKQDLMAVGIEAGKCIDDGLIGRLFGINVSHRKDRYQRPECRCVESQDIGEYNTCTHGCLYCYATFNKSRAHRNQSLHDPAAPFLTGRPLDPL